MACGRGLIKSGTDRHFSNCGNYFSESLTSHQQLLIHKIILKKHIHSFYEQNLLHDEDDDDNAVLWDSVFLWNCRLRKMRELRKRLSQQGAPPPPPPPTLSSDVISPNNVHVLGH